MTAKVPAMDTELATFSPEQKAPDGNARGFFMEDDSLWLPPQEYRKPLTEKIPTPTDDRGLIDISELIRVVKATIEPEYEWPSYASNHHFYWPGNAYPHDFTGLVNPAYFRNLSIHKGNIPRVFENWLHEITIPPAVPSEEVMHYRVQAWDVALNLFKSARQVVRWERLIRQREEYVLDNPTIITRTEQGEDIGAEINAKIIARHFKGLDMHLARLERVPSEFRLCDANITPQQLATRLGEIVVPRAMPLTGVVRQTERPAA